MGEIIDKALLPQAFLLQLLDLALDLCSHQIELQRQIADFIIGRDHDSFIVITSGYALGCLVQIRDRLDQKFGAESHDQGDEDQTDKAHLQKIVVLTQPLLIDMGDVFDHADDQPLMIHLHSTANE